MCCFTLKSRSTTTSPSSTSPSPSQQASPTTLNLTNEYISAVQTNSYKEIWEKIQQQQPSSSSSPSHLVAQFLKPDKGSIQEALRHAKPNNLTRLVSTYFDRSEHTSHLFILLYLSVDRARSLYAPLYTILELFPSFHHFTQAQCDLVLGSFLEFDRLDNPFLHPDFREMRRSFFQLKLQLDKARNRACLFRRRATASSSHHYFTKKQLHHISQLDAAAKGTYALYNDLDTIDHLVTRLHDALESDKRLIRFGLDRGRDRYPIQEVVNQLRKNQPNFLKLLKDLEEHVCLCFAAVNRARSLLLQEIQLH